MELEYKNYYLRTIHNRSNGIKLVLGGTGLGKTHGMREAVIEYLNSDHEEKRKFIYITNRHNLITEQQKQFSKAGFKCCYLKSNREIILELLKNNQIEELIEDFGANDFFKFDEQLKNKYKRETKLNKLVESIESKLQLWKSEKEKPRNHALTKAIDRELSFDCDELFKIFKTQAILVGRNDELLYAKLISNKSAWKLFPYVEFENNPDANILLVTIQKVLMGFFDGKKDIKIASVEKKIIFLDEFDFLEREIIKILCDEPSIINPLEFVRIFYEKFKHWSVAEFWDSTEYYKGVRDKFNEVIKYLEDKTKAKGLTFPSVIDFRLEKKPAEASKSYMLFQTNEIITPKRFFLKEKNNSWYIQDEKTSESVSPFELFNILAIATSKILGVFHYYQKDPNLVSEIIQTIWNQKNDNTGGRYEDYINENCLYHRTKAKSGKGFELYKDKSPYEIGFRLVKLAKRTNSFDPNSAELGQVELFTSPEAVIAKLSDENLVFALSATADIPRTLKCFNLDWLEKNATFIPLDDRDYEIIKARRDRKRDLRQTKVSLRIAGQLNEEHPVSVVCKSLLNNGNFTKNGSEHENASVARSERVLRIFDTLYHCLSGNKYSHLIFVTTFDGFKDIIDYKNNKNSLLFLDCDIRTFSCNRYYPKNDKLFQMTLNGKECSVLLLNSEDAKELQENPDALETYKKCFELKDKVFVITQYQSASNGINLPCYARMGSIESDFEGIHLLEQNHFWFDSSEDINEFKNHEKQALWYLWKLMDAGQIDSSQFKISLSARDPKNPYKIDIRQINKLYKDKADEKTLNSIALFHQALGRIERRDEQLLEVDVTLEQQVFQDFHVFLSSENFKELIEKREKITSSLILNIHQAVIDMATKMDIHLELSGHKSFGDKNKLSSDLINEMLSEIAKVRGGNYDEVVSMEIRLAWIELREAILKHDYNKRINLEVLGKTIHIKRDFAFETKFVNRNKELYIDSDKHRVYREKVPSRKLTTWNLDLAYRIVSKHPLLNRHFENRGYKMSFDIKPNSVNHILTPYIYQAILLGAIGEEAIGAILAHYNISLDSFSNLDNAIFELVDAKVKDAPVYFDYKNFGFNTLNKFSQSPTNLEFDAELNSNEFMQKIKAKYDLLKTKEENSILYILNLYSEHKRTPDLFDSNMKRVKYEKDSCIRIIPSILNSTDIEKISADFEASLKLITAHETASI